MDKLGTFPLTLIEKSDSGSFEGYASVFDVVDQQGEIVERGAFAKTLRELRKSGRPLPLTADHETSADGVIGSAESVKEDSRGLWAKFRFAADARSQALREKALGGHLAGLSIFGRIIQSAERMVDGRPVNVLKEIQLMAVGLTPFPANGSALGTAKTETAEAESFGFDQFADSMRKALDIPHPAAKEAAVKVLLGAYRAEPAAGPVEPTADEIEKDEDPSNASAYALGIAGMTGPDVPPGGEPSESLAESLIASLDAAKTSSELDLLEEQIGKELGHE